ncbi:MAG: glutathione S-transferase [Oceanospirillaceae bacterium]
MQLVIGNKNYSSWSLRPWLLMQHFGLTFQEQQIWLYSTQMNSQMQRFSPSLKVPVLIDQDTIIWDSLAICEHLNEQHLAGKAWPADQAKRATARSICAEMHSGFNAIRNEMPMNCRRAVAPITLSASAKQEIARICEIFELCLENNDSSTDTNKESDFLFTQFSIADAFYMPIVARFHSYAITVSDKVNRYMQTMLQLPAYQLWLSQAQAEEAVIAVAEV